MSAADGSGGRSAGVAGQGAGRVLVLGGTSEIALAIVGDLQDRAPREVALAGRDAGALERAAEELHARGCARAITLKLDALDLDSHDEVLARAFAELGEVDLVIVAVGVLGERGGMPSDIASAVDVLEVNLLGAGSLVLRAAARLRDSGGGTLIVLSSVAAERPRRQNVVYGASKAGLDALARGLDEALRERGVRVLVVRPGFVHTRMTKGLPAAPLATTPAAVAAAVIKGLDRGARVVWAPPSLRWLMLVVRMLPRPVFRRLRG